MEQKNENRRMRTDVRKERVRKETIGEPHPHWWDPEDTCEEIMKREQYYNNYKWFI